MHRTGDPPTASHPFRRAALILVVLTGAALTVGAGAADRLVFTQVPIESGFDLPAGSRIVSFDPSRPRDGVTNLTGGFSAAGRPDISFDGQRILFVGRRTPDEAFDAWEMNTDGSGPRRITNQAADILQAIYLSTIYTIDDAEPADQIAFCQPDDDGTRSLYTCRVDGTRVARITFDPYGATDPCALSDGRLLFTGGPESALLTVNTDGTDVFVFGAAHAPAVSRGMPCETDDGWIVFVESPNDVEDRGGALVAVSRTSSLGARRVIDDGVSGRYRSPAPAGAGKLLVSFRRPEMPSYGLYWFVPESGKRTGVFNPRQWHELDAVVVRPRARPAGRLSLGHGAVRGRRRTAHRTAQRLQGARRKRPRCRQARRRRNRPGAAGHGPGGGRRLVLPGRSRPHAVASGDARPRRRGAPGHAQLVLGDAGRAPRLHRLP
jgi:hypothetical protein